MSAAICPDAQALAMATMLDPYPEIRIASRNRGITLIR
jgi:hypothetical protein